MLNPGFEQTSVGAYTSASAVNGWTIQSTTNSGICTYTNWSPGSSEFSILSTPVSNWPTANSPISSIGNSPLGGTVVAQLNDTVNDYTITRIRQTFPVSSTTSFIQIAYAGFWQNGGSTHGCCNQAGFEMRIYDYWGNLIQCKSIYMTPGSGCQSSGLSYSVSSSAYWTNWQVKTIDLSPFVGSAVTLELCGLDCSVGEHFGTTLVDVALCNYCGYSQFPPYLGPPNTNSVSYCSGSNKAILEAPGGYSYYYWMSPLTGTIAGTAQTLTITNVISSLHYTLYCITSSGCAAMFEYPINTTQVKVLGIGSSPSCPGGTSGSATVSATGSSIGYTYTWVNSSNSVVATNSVVTDLSSGTYTVTLGSTSLTSCGTASASIAVGSAAHPTQTIFQPFCSNQTAYITPPLSGINQTWYNNGSAITGSLGSASTLTVNSPCNSCIFQLSYDTYQGCKDSIQYVLVTVAPGAISVPFSSIKNICASASNGTAALSFTPAFGVPYGLVSYQVVNTGSTPAYSSSLAGGNTSTYTIGGLSSGTYSITGFDGACTYSNTFSVTPVTFDYTISPIASTVCPGFNQLATINFSNYPLPGAYTYSWSPTTWLLAGNGALQNTIITPTLSSVGSTATTIYTVVVTPSIANCPVTKTMAITTMTPPTPVIVPISAAICSNANPITLTVVPTGGTFSNGPLTPFLVNSSGVLLPYAAQAGSNFVVYSVSFPGCSASDTLSFSVSLFRTAALLQKHNSRCQGPGLLDLNTIPFDPGAGIWSGKKLSGTMLDFSKLAPGQHELVYNTFSTPDSLLCADSDTLKITIYPTPVISILSGQICKGASFILNPQGAFQYTFSSGNAYVSPSITTSYSIWGQSTEGCKSKLPAIAIVSVNPLPVVNAISSQSLVCAGEFITLTASGADSYQWVGGPDTNVFIAQPYFTTIYEVTGWLNGCQSKASVIQEVDECLGISKTKGRTNSVYPNPARGYVIINGEGFPNLTRIEILDVSGRIIIAKQPESDHDVISLENLTSGIYFVRLENNEALISIHKLLVE